MDRDPGRQSSPERPGEAYQTESNVGAWLRPQGHALTKRPEGARPAGLEQAGVRGRRDALFLVDLTLFHYGIVSSTYQT